VTALAAPRPTLLAAAIGLATFFAVAYILLAMPVLPDTDSYFHLAVARLYAEEGMVNALPWARYSVMHERYGDKELLFHLLLIPVTFGDAATNGRLAVAALNGVIAALLALLGIELAGRHGAWLAPLLYATAPYFWSRTIRLRPELLSLILLLAILLAARRGRAWLCALLACAYALGYTAFHVVAALALLLMTPQVSSLATRPATGEKHARGLANQRCRPGRLGMLATRRWRIGLSILGGLGAGLLLHPHFPDNLAIWWLQNVRYFLLKSSLDVGVEIGAPRIIDLVLHNAGWWLAAIALAILLRPKRPDAFVGVPAAVFAALQLAMERMSIYFFPFASLALMRRDETRRVRGAWLAAIAILAIAASAPFTIASLRHLMQRVPPDLERDYAAMAARIPPGAKIAARWGPTDAYVFYAPQGRYLDVLDPLFMAVAHPRAYAAYRRLFEDPSADLAAIAKDELDSDYLAFPKFEAGPAFLARVRAHPRITILHDGYNVLAKID
jgi:hypothetical protein